MNTFKLTNKGITMKVYQQVDGIIMLELHGDNQRIAIELDAYELTAIEEYVDNITNELATAMEA